MPYRNPRTVMTENSVQWFSNDSKEPFLEYFIESDEVKIYNEKQYFHEAIWLGQNSAIRRKNDWLPENGSNSLKITIYNKILSKLIKFSKTKYAWCSTKLRRFGKVKTIMTENSIQCFSEGYEEPFAEYFIDLDDFKIYDNEIYILERHEALRIPDLFEINFSDYWYPKKCPKELKFAINDIIWGKFFTNKEKRAESIKLFKETGFFLLNVYPS